MKSSKLIFFLIILLAFFLRFYEVADIPPSLNWDEVSIGYNAYSVLKTGRDEWGVFLPLHFKSYGEFKLPVQLYASIPGIYLFGLNELGLRITPVVYGTLTVLLLYFLGKVLFRKKEIGLIAAFLLAISPWHIQLTRASFESSFACFWVVLAVLFLVKGFSEKKYLVYSTIPFLISIYTYNTARIFTPLYLSVIFLIYFKDFIKLKKTIFIAFLIFVVGLLPLIPFTLSGEAGARLKLVSIINDPGLLPRVNENRGNSNLPSPLNRFVHSQYTYIVFYYLRNYLSHFSPDYLFISGASHKQHHVQEIGQLYLFQAPFLLIGLYLLFKRKEKFRWILILWILLTHVPVAIANDSVPHALRNLISAPAYQLLTALGLYEAFMFLNSYKTNREIPTRKLLRYSYLLVLGVSLLGVYQFQAYLNNYYSNYSRLYSRDWQYGYKEAVEYIQKNQDKYDEVVFTRHYGEPHMFTLFFENYPPEMFQNNLNLVRFETHDWVRVLNFDKYFFPDLGDEGTKYQDIIKANPDKKLLFIGKPGDFPAESKKLETIYFLNGQVAFEIVEKT